MTFWAKQYTRLFAVRFMRFIRDHQDLWLFTVKFMRLIYLVWMRMIFNFGHNNLRGYLQLDLCVALGSSMDSGLNTYAVLTVFVQTSQFTNFVTQKERLQ